MNKALLIGINEYPDAPLKGCVNDVTNAAEFLVSKCGFKKSEIRILTDKRATTQAIIDRCHWLITGTIDDDRLVLWYSGHGVLWTGRDAKGNVGTPECAICPVDFDWTREHVITAGDLSGIFSHLPKGTKFQWVSDSCHSGDLARELRYQARSYPLNADMWWRDETAKEARVQPEGLEKAIEHLNGAFIAGCGRDQTSADAFIGTKYCGALSHYLLEQLNSVGMALPLCSLVALVGDRLHKNGYSQQPQLRGSEVARDNKWLDLK